MLLTIVFIADLLIPLGIATGVMYVVSIFIAYRQRRRIILLIGVLAAILTIIKLSLFYSADTGYMVFANRIISLAAIMIATLLGIRYNTLDLKARKDKNDYIRSIEQMLFITSHKVRKPVTSCLGLVNLLDTPDTSESDIRQALSYLKESAIELDDFTRELSAFIEQANKRQKSSVSYLNLIAV